MKTIMILLIITLSGCVSMGTPVSDSQMSMLKNGVTTESDVIARLGQPNGVGKTSDGKKVLTYNYAHASPTAISFVPIVGLFAGGSNVQSTIVTLNFDQAGILQDYSSTQTQTNGGIGMSSTGYQP